MAFDPLLTEFALAADLAGLSDEYISASLLATAVGCIMKQRAEWWDADVMPDENVFREADSFFDDLQNETPETSANFVLLVRSALAAGRK